MFINHIKEFSKYQNINKEYRKLNTAFNITNNILIT